MACIIFMDLDSCRNVKEAIGKQEDIHKKTEEVKQFFCTDQKSFFEMAVCSLLERAIKKQEPRMMVSKMHYKRAGCPCYETDERKEYDLGFMCRPLIQCSDSWVDASVKCVRM